MNYTITGTSQNGDTLTTNVVFTYYEKSLEVKVPHFQPKSIQEIEVSIQNRIASEIKKIDAENLASTIIIPIGEEKVIEYIPIVAPEENPLSKYTTEELKQQIAILSNEYNIIMEQRNIINSQLSDNSSKYDLLIDELAKRV